MTAYPFSDDDVDIVQRYCSTCRKTTDHERVESLNWGNQIGMCRECDDVNDLTEIDHAGILREARRGW
jgi:hypothetical protein